MKVLICRCITCWCFIIFYINCLSNCNRITCTILYSISSCYCNSCTITYCRCYIISYVSYCWIPITVICLISHYIWIRGRNITETFYINSRRIRCCRIRCIRNINKLSDICKITTSILYSISSPYCSG